MSQLTQRFLFTRRKGKVVLDDKDRFEKALMRYEDKDGFLTIEPIYKQRSLQENRYLFGVVIPVLNETEDFGGWDKEAVYRYLEFKFLNDFPGEKPREWVKIKELTTIDFEELMERIREWAAIEFGANIPVPNEAVVLGEVIL